MGIIERQNDVFFEGDGTRRVLICDKTCETAYIIKWAVLLSLFGIFFLWLIIGYWHAKRRIAKGLPPLAYHRVRIFLRQIQASLPMRKCILTGM